MCNSLYKGMMCRFLGLSHYLVDLNIYEYGVAWFMPPTSPQCFRTGSYHSASNTYPSWTHPKPKKSSWNTLKCELLIHENIQKKHPATRSIVFEALAAIFRRYMPHIAMNANQLTMTGCNPSQDYSSIRSIRSSPSAVQNERYLKPSTKSLTMIQKKCA